MWLEAEGKSHSQISSQNCAPLLFHLVLILPHQIEKCQIRVLRGKQCVGVAEGKQAGGFPRKGETSLFAPYRQKAMAALHGAGLTE